MERKIVIAALLASMVWAPRLSVAGSSACDGGAQVFNLTGPVTKKRIDMLFVVDNSGSMKAYQQALSKGMKKVAGTYFYDRKLDICLAITTSERWKYRQRKGHEAADRLVGCTNPDSLSGASDAEFKAQVDQLVADFQSKVMVGVDGGATELLARSMSSFAFDLDSFPDSVNQPGLSKANAFFRKPAGGEVVTHLTFVTDENNYCGVGDMESAPSTRCSGILNEKNDPEKNDLPAFLGSKVWDGATADPRKGVQEHLAALSELVRGKGKPAMPVSMTAFLRAKLDGKGNPVYDAQGNLVLNPTDGSLNLSEAARAQGNGSGIEAIQANADGYAKAYQKVMQNLIAMFSRFELCAAKPQVDHVEHLRAGKVFKVMVDDLDYTISGKILQIDSNYIAGQVQPGDQVRVVYVGV